VCVLCGSPVWPSPPVVGPLWPPPLCVGPLCVSPVRVPCVVPLCGSPLCGSPVWVPCVGPLCGSLVALRPSGIYSRDVSRSFTRSRSGMTSASACPPPSGMSAPSLNLVDFRRGFSPTDRSSYGECIMHLDQVVCNMY